MRSALPVAVLSATLLVSCSMQSPVAPVAPSANPAPPAPDASLTTLTVRVLARGSEQPIAGAVIRTAATSAVSDSLGVCVMTVALGPEIEVDVTAPGYERMSA